VPIVEPALSEVEAMGHLSDGIAPKKKKHKGGTRRSLRLARDSGQLTFNHFFVRLWKASFRFDP
jgi:hypothetical protein